jgi:hypothetical protein
MPFDGLDQKLMRLCSPFFSSPVLIVLVTIAIHRVLLIECCGVVERQKDHHYRVQAFQFTINYWRVGLEGEQNCGPELSCVWTNSDNLQVLKQRYHNVTNAWKSSIIGSKNGPTANVAAHHKKKQSRPITIGVYNIHSWWERMKQHGPAVCELPTLLNIAESEESRVRYHMLFDPTFKYFDAYSTTHPESHIQRAYDGAYICGGRLSQARQRQCQPRSCRIHDSKIWFPGGGARSLHAYGESRGRETAH